MHTRDFSRIIITVTKGGFVLPTFCLQGQSPNALPLSIPVRVNSDNIVDDNNDNVDCDIDDNENRTFLY